MGASVGGKGLVSEINVTPFVDVMLVLLIIFMVTAPMMDQGLEVDLPQTQYAETLPAEAEHLVLTIREDGVILLDSYEVPLEELEAKLIQNLPQKGNSLFLQADKNVPYGLVVDVMGRVKAAGVDKLGVIALPREPQALPVAAPPQ